MPYELGKRPGRCGKGRPYAVIKQETGEVVPGGCHKTHEEALRHQRALTVNVTLKEKADEQRALSEVASALVARSVPEHLAYKPAAQLTQKERMQLARAGLARPDGSYPIRNATELGHAILAYGHAKPSERAAVKAWIVRRARALRATAQLPAGWS